MTNPEFEPIPLPPNYEVEKTIEGMMPGDVAFIYPFGVKQDLVTRGLYVDTSKTLSDDETVKPYIPPEGPVNRLGLMRVYREIGGSPVDGYVLDISDMKPGEIKTEKLFPDKDSSDYDNKILSASKDKWGKVLGLRYRDGEGEVQFSGPEWLRDAGEYISEATELKRKKLIDESPRESLMPNVEVIRVPETSALEVESNIPEPPKD